MNIKNRPWYIEWYEEKKQKYGKKIASERTNFFFLKDGSMAYPTNHYNSFVDAMIDAIVNGKEDVDDMIDHIYPEKADHPKVKKTIEKLLSSQN